MPRRSKTGLLPPSLAELRRTSRRYAPRNDAAMSADSNFKQLIHVRVLAARSARVVQDLFPRKEGAGNAGCALHPRSRVPICTGKSTHEHTGSAEAVRHSLRNGFTAYAVLSSATNSSCHRRCRLGGLIGPGWIDLATDSLTPATGVGTTRFCRTQPPVFAKRLRRAWRRSSRACRSLIGQNPPCDINARRRCRVHRILSQRS